MKITISNNGENRTVVDEAKDDKPKNGGRFNWSRLGPVNQVQENYSGRERGHGRGSGSKKSANERLIRSGSLEDSNDALSVSQNSGKGGRGRGTTRGSGKQRKSANERLVRAPQAPTSASRFRGGSNELNNNIVNEPMEVDFQPPVRSDTSSPNCICLRPLKMVLCRICGHNFEGRVQKTCIEHPMDTYLLDVPRCPRSTCRVYAKDLLEYPLPKNYIPVKINSKLV